MLICILAISVIDFKTKLIHHRFLLIWIILLVLYYGVDNPLNFYHLGGALFVVTIMLIMNGIYHHAFGGGDLKWMLITGYFIGLNKSIELFIIAVFSATIYALYLIMHKKGRRESEIAFGPFLCIGFIAVLNNVSLINLVG